MAQRRMFSPKIVASDAFLDMPTSSRELYFQLGMYADDDGFVNPKRIVRMIGASEDDLKVLVAKRFVIPFENGVVVIKHWAINNLIRKDFYRETSYLEQKKMLVVKENGAYTEAGNKMLTISSPSIGKDRIGKDTTEKSVEKEEKLINRKNIEEVIHYFYELKGWKYKSTPAQQNLFRRYLRPAKELLELCEGSLTESKECIKKLADWAISRELDWSIETVFKKWYELDFLKPKEKKPHYDGCRIFQKVKDGRWWIIRNGEIKELGKYPSKEEIIWK